MINYTWDYLDLFAKGDYYAGFDLTPFQNAAV